MGVRMQRIYVFSGPCGCGKTTLATAFAAQHDAPVCLIHGDDFQAGLITPEAAEGPAWPDVLRFNWACILANARAALHLGVDVVIDYIVEDELPLLQALARETGAALHYTVLTADEATLRHRLTSRGDAWLIDRALVLKAKLEAMPENQGRLLDVTGMTTQYILRNLP